jgi:superfamily II DNA helicase RecQ
VALLALFDQRRIWRDEDGNLRREDRDPTAARLSLGAMAARKDADYRRLEAMIAYCKESVCHRARLLRYFGETTPRDYRCGNCSACLGGAVRPRGKAAQAEVDRLLQAHSAILESAGPVSTRTFALFLGGSASKRVPVQWRELDGYGALAHIPSEELHVLAAGALNHGKHQPAGSGNGRPHSRGAVATDKDAQCPLLTGDSEERTVFWRSRDRVFTVQHLQRIGVPRRRGISILELVAENEGKLPPSGVANVLRGSRSSSVVKAHPDLLNSKQFGIEKGKKYEDLLPDVLAMIAKGYLRYDNENTKRLVLTAKARTIVGRK